jgi:hypothetical protein
LSAEHAFLHVLHAAEREGSRFTHAQVASWDAADLERFERLGILKRIDGSIADCPDCEIGHVGEIHVSIDGAGRQRRHLACPLDGRVEVSADSCSEWVVAPAALAGAVALAFGTAGKPRPVGHGVWKLGRCKLGDSSREVVLLLNASAAGEVALATHVGQSGRAIVVTPVREPDGRIWHGAAPAVILLCDLAELQPDGIAIEPLEVLDRVRRADAAAERKSLFPIDPRIKKEVIAQQVHEAIKEVSDDDLCLAAYKEIPSYRRAAEHLTKTLGRRFTKEDISGAVDRAGGLKAVQATHDSGSVLRPVASSKRDRAKRKAQSGI